MKYKVKISEVLSNTITVEADSTEEAINLAKTKYLGCEIILMSDDLEQTEFIVEEIKNEN
jgi:hypothetical protein